MRVAVKTLGCRVNQADTIALQDALRARSVQLVAPDERADVYVVNTCTVTHTADADARRVARRMRRRNPDARVIVTGCYAQVDAATLRALPEVDLVVGNDGKSGLADAILAQGAPAIPDQARPRRPTWPARVRPAGAHVTAMPESHTRPFLKVQDGCDYSCAFCIIPRARGVSRSLSVAEVTRQALAYAELGARELVLTGIHLGHWGRDLTPRVPLHALLLELLDALARDGRIARVRLGSVEPNEVTPTLIAMLREHPLLCEHLHVPLQSGDDAVLRRMRRLYTTDAYQRVVADLRAALPDAAIGADVLVGHPGEDRASFERTLAFLDQVDWTYLHVFPFSPRKGTPSATMADQVPATERSARVRTLIRRSDVRRHLFHRAQLGRTREWLTLGTKGSLRRAISRNYVPALLDLETAPHQGAMLRAAATRAEPDHVGWSQRPHGRGRLRELERA